MQQHYNIFKEHPFRVIFEGKPHEGEEDDDDDVDVEFGSPTPMVTQGDVLAGVLTGYILTST